MSEITRGGEPQLTPAQIFRRIIDGYFETVGGQGKQNTPRSGEEEVNLRLPDSVGMWRTPPRAALATRPIPGQEELTAHLSQGHFGHKIDTYTYPQSSYCENRTYFFLDDELWSNTSGIISFSGGVKLPEPNKLQKFTPIQAAVFLDCLRRATPVLLEDPPAGPLDL